MSEPDILLARRKLAFKIAEAISNHLFDGHEFDIEEVATLIGRMIPDTYAEIEATVGDMEMAAQTVTPPRPSTFQQLQALLGLNGLSIGATLRGTIDEIELLRNQLETERGHRDADNAESKAEIERLQAIVDKLPKTADGVPVVPSTNTFVYRLLRDTGNIQQSKGWDRQYPTFRSEHLLGDEMMACDLCYSTRQVAEAAKGVK